MQCAERCFWIHSSEINGSLVPAPSFLSVSIWTPAIFSMQAMKAGKIVAKTAAKTVKGRKRCLKKSRNPEQPPRMTADEVRLIRDMVHEQDKTPTEVASILNRDLSSVCRQLKKTRPAKMGRPAKLSVKQIEKLAHIIEGMVNDADANYEVTLAMVLRRSRFKISERTAARALHQQGYRFRKLRSRMILTPDDIKARYAWAKKYTDKSRSWWLKKVHIHLDNHHFKHATTSQGRRLLAKRSVRGVYRKAQIKAKKSLSSAHVKPNPKLRTNLGSKGFLKCGGIGGGKVLVWQTIDSIWCGDEAAKTYTNVILPALKSRYRGCSKFTILEDNDPTGNLSQKGIVAKQQGKMVVLQIPKRSPDLNVLDYVVWAKVEKLLRKQEQKMANKTESREQFEKRLDKTALSFSEEDIDNWVGSLHQRCQQLFAAKGGLFEEGGRSKRRRSA